MKKINSEKKELKELDTLINEPKKPILGGSKRKSVIISRKKFPKIALRERLNSLLLTHCYLEDISSQLLPDDELILHQIALETITCGSYPAIRKKAIWALGFYDTERTIELLKDLAEYGEDEYIRCHALQSLGSMKKRSHVNIFINALKDNSNLVITVAIDALRKQLDSYGVDFLKSTMKDVEDITLKQKIDSIIQTYKVVKKEADKD
ncbi:MAG: HEAT repeat domain-containing protein [Candidatus Thorarchaeota archaeon]